MSQNSANFDLSALVALLRGVPVLTDALRDVPALNPTASRVGDGVEPKLVVGTGGLSKEEDGVVQVPVSNLTFGQIGNGVEPKLVVEKGGLLCEEGKALSSWSEEVEEVEAASLSEASAQSAEVSGGESAVVGGPKSRVMFGGVADLYPEVGVGPGGAAPETGFMRLCVRTPGVSALRKFVEAKAGCRIPKSLMSRFAVCAYTAATMPVGFNDGRGQLKGFEIVGDAALSLYVVMGSVAKGESVGSVQSVRSRITSNCTLSRICVASGLSSYVSFAAGIDLETSGASAGALEAVVGFLSMYRGQHEVCSFLRAMQLLDPLRGQ